MMSTRSFAVAVVLMGFLAGAALPAEAARKSDQTKTKAKKTTRKAKQKDASRTSKRSAAAGEDTSLRGRFEQIETPKVAGASKIRLRWARGQGDVGAGKVFSVRKIALSGRFAETKVSVPKSLKAKVLATTKRRTKRSE